MTTLYGVREAVLALPAQPPRYGLLVAANDLSSADDRWQGGVQWAPEQNNGGGAVATNCHGNTASLTPGTNIGTATADPFVVWAEDHCSTLGWQARDYEGRARRQLEATQSARIANELWSGTLAQAAGLGNIWLTKDPEIVSSGGLDARPALGLLDEAVGAAFGGRRAMIHCTAQLLSEFTAGGIVSQSGQIWTTPMGTVVVADAGYPGTGPDGTNTGKQFIYGTPMIGYRLSPVMLAPGSLADARAQAINRDTNLITIYAERLALLQWDSDTPIGGTGKVGVVAVETTVAAFTL